MQKIVTECIAKLADYFFFLSDKGHFVCKGTHFNILVENALIP